MVKFSKELGGVVLPHDTFGFHLNSKGETIDRARIFFFFFLGGGGMVGRYWLKSGLV